MKTFTASLLIAIAFLSLESYAGEQGKLPWMKFNEGVSEAKKSGKKVMIDVYTDWCGWCKRMDKDTYEDAAVVGYLNTHYVAIKLNAESSTTLQYQGQSYTEQELAAAFGVSGYPSIIFLGNDGEAITVYPGYADADKFKVVLSYIAEGHYKATTFQDYAGAKQ